jgi:hypothetical protein
VDLDQDAAGSGLNVTNKAYVHIEKSELINNYKSGLKLDQDADVLMVKSAMFVLPKANTSREILPWRMRSACKNVGRGI